MKPRATFEWCCYNSILGTEIRASDITPPSPYEAFTDKRSNEDIITLRKDFNASDLLKFIERAVDFSEKPLNDSSGNSSDD